ncbi:Outer dense fiber protein 3, partial [Apaloderma vittatum]
WVSTWRPHHPPGLILAQFTSPKPKYTIPGTTARLAHYPTKAKALAYTFQGVRPPTTDGSPGPCYCIHSSITRNGKYVALVQPICGHHTMKTKVTPGPSDYCTTKADKLLYKCAPAQPLSFQHKDTRFDQAPGKATQGNTCTCSLQCLLQGMSTAKLLQQARPRQATSLPLLQIPDPAVFPKVDKDIYKKRAPMYSITTKSSLGGDKTARPGPAGYCLGKVSQLTKPQARTPTFGLRHSLYK